MSATDTTVSIEDHLVQTLRPLLAVLPTDICQSLATELNGSEIHASVLYQISRWARTDAAISSLKSRHLNPREYDNVASLMAGTRTAPTSVPPPNQKTAEQLNHEESQRARNDKKALAMVLNGTLSVICSGVAGWWAADKSGWRDEWKVLFSLLVAAVVGVAETALFIIWQSRVNSPNIPATLNWNYRRQQQTPMLKKSGDGGEKPHPALPTAGAPIIGDGKPDNNVRRRKGRKYDL